MSVTIKPAVRVDTLELLKNVQTMHAAMVNMDAAIRALIGQVQANTSDINAMFNALVDGGYIVVEDSEASKKVEEKPPEEKKAEEDVADIRS